MKRKSAPTQDSKPMRVAVIGTGKISDEHVRFICADPRCTPVGVCDLSPSLARYAAACMAAKPAQAWGVVQFTLLRARGRAPSIVEYKDPMHTGPTEAASRTV